MNVLDPWFRSVQHVMSLIQYSQEKLYLPNFYYAIHETTNQYVALAADALAWWYANWFDCMWLEPLDWLNERDRCSAILSQTGRLKIPKKIPGFTFGVGVYHSSTGDKENPSRKERHSYRPLAPSWGTIGGGLRGDGLMASGEGWGLKARLDW